MLSAPGCYFWAARSEFLAPLAALSVADAAIWNKLPRWPTPQISELPGPFLILCCSSALVEASRPESYRWTTFERTEQRYWPSPAFATAPRWWLPAPKFWPRETPCILWAVDSESYLICQDFQVRGLHSERQAEMRDSCNHQAYPRGGHLWLISESQSPSSVSCQLQKPNLSHPWIVLIKFESASLLYKLK